MVPGTPPHIRKTSLDQKPATWGAIDTEILACQTLNVFAIWQKAQLVSSLADDPRLGDLYEPLATSMSICRDLADKCLAAVDIQPE